jgi:2-oxoglutarate ferredoxin oxidoreductase subunit alpha
MTATSGPGFALMTELITHGVMAEIPAVIINAQRGGPSTGLPTKTEQSDLHAAVFGGPGDSARIVIAPSNVEECYYYVMKSFQIAEKYQTPVIVLTDFFLDNRVENIDIPKSDEEHKACWNVLPEQSTKNDYFRYQFSSSGISPRSIPGMDGFNFTATGLEHTEKGTPDYSPETHSRMTEKRHRKILNALVDLKEPEEFLASDTLDVGVIGWGSTFGSIVEAVEKSRKKGLKVGALKISSIFPFHADVIRNFMEKSRVVLIPELNYQGQLANLISHLDSKTVERLNLVTGTPIPPSLIQARIEALLEGIDK